LIQAVLLVDKIVQTSMPKNLIYLRDGFSYFCSGGDKYLGVLLLALAGGGGNTRKGQGKSLTKFVF
jgi:hypothetical protein